MYAFLCIGNISPRVLCSIHFSFEIPKYFIEVKFLLFLFEPVGQIFRVREILCGFKIDLLISST